MSPTEERRGGDARWQEESGYPRRSCASSGAHEEGRAHVVARVGAGEATRLKERSREEGQGGGLGGGSRGGLHGGLGGGLGGGCGVGPGAGGTWRSPRTIPKPDLSLLARGGSGEAAPGLVIGEHPQQVISWVLISSLHWGAVSLLEAGLEMLGGDSLPVLMHRAPAAPR